MKVIEDGKSIQDIARTVQDYLRDTRQENDFSVQQWLTEHKGDVLRWAMPSVERVIMAFLKKTSGVEPYASEGAAEIQVYAAELVKILQKFDS